MGGNSAWRKRVKNGEVPCHAGGAIMRHSPHLQGPPKKHNPSDNPKKKRRRPAEAQANAPTSGSAALEPAAPSAPPGFMHHLTLVAAMVAFFAECHKRFFIQSSRFGEITLVMAIVASAANTYGFNGRQSQSTGLILVLTIVLRLDRVLNHVGNPFDHGDR